MIRSGLGEIASVIYCYSGLNEIDYQEAGWMELKMKGLESRMLNATMSVAENEDSKVYIMRNETGEGGITDYEILEDINLLYSDFHMNSVISEERRNVDCLAIDYCYEGRSECSFVDGKFVYQKPGDLSLDSRKKGFEGFFFPLSHYHSLSIIFFLPKAQASLEKSFPGFPVNLRELRKKFLAHSYPCFIQNHREVSNIFEALRTVNIKNKNTYIVTKILELLLILDSMDVADLSKTNDYAYYHKSDVEKVKLIQNLMVEDLEHHYTLNELSEEFKIPLTAMTGCFKGVFGKPINTYMREYRMSYAAKELLLSEFSIADIGLKVGYTNPSKFSKAFRQVIGVPPKEYRKRKGELHDEKG